VSWKYSPSTAGSLLGHSGAGTLCISRGLNNDYAKSKKAIDHARKQIAANKSVFAE
jgi:hypothetical protein